LELPGATEPVNAHETPLSVGVIGDPVKGNLSGDAVVAAAIARV